MSALIEFLKKNQITMTDPLPVVHTTESYYLKKIIHSGQLTARPCNVFNGEKLNYFFVGRPAYKKLGYGEQYWELPSCLVFEYFTDGIKRIFPFDTGAFNAKLYPTYIQMMDLSDFEVSKDIEAPKKIIGTFFDSPQDYYRLRPTNRDKFEQKFDVGVLDEEILALHQLINEGGKNFADDRRFTIEMQYESDVSLTERRLICIILPEQYLTNEEYLDRLLDTGAEIITYPTYPLKMDYYYYTIYEKLDNFYKKMTLYGGK